MNVRELADLCSNWDNSAESFARIVASTEQLGLYQRELAVEFEVAESTVSRWARGIARPLPRLQKLIVVEIGKRAKKAAASVAKAGGASLPSYSIAAKPPR